MPTITAVMRSGAAILVASALLAAASGCERAAPPVAPRPPVTIETLDWPEVVTVAEGAYVRGGLGSPLWFVQGHEAVRVRGLPADMLRGEILPAADGGAYLVLPDGVWYLHGATATKVREVAGIASTATPVSTTLRERWLWALLQVERTRAQRAADAAVYDNAYDDEPPPDAYDYVR